MMHIDLRRVILEDADLLYRWQQHKDTRKYFFNPKCPTWDEHILWLKSSLERKDRCLLIAEINSKPVGLLRYDFFDEDVEVSIYLDPDQHGQGIGVKLLQRGNHWIQSNFPSVKVIKAKVKAENIASKKCFEKAGFSESSVVYYHEIE